MQNEEANAVSSARKVVADRIRKFLKPQALARMTSSKLILTGKWLGNQDSNLD
jgi:hypothetical protein